MLERQRTQGRRELRHWRKLEQLRCPSIEDSAGRHSWVAPGYYHLVAIWFLGSEPQGRSSGSHPTRPQSSRSWSCTCWQGGCMLRWEGWECFKHVIQALERFVGKRDACTDEKVENVYNHLKVTCRRWTSLQDKRREWGRWRSWGKVRAPCRTHPPPVLNKVH